MIKVRHKASIYAATIIIASLIASLFLCAKKETLPKDVVYHIVICWLKEPGNAQHRARLINVSRMFRDIPGVQNVSCGHMLPSTRPVVDTTFDIAIVMTFTDIMSMKKYIEHPEHKKAVAEVLRPLAKKVVVYDFVNE